jgi:hypothetical protein
LKGWRDPGRADAVGDIDDAGELFELGEEGDGDVGVAAHSMFGGAEWSLRGVGSAEGGVEGDECGDDAGIAHLEWFLSHSSWWRCVVKEWKRTKEEEFEGLWSTLARAAQTRHLASNRQGCLALGTPHHVTAPWFPLRSTLNLNHFAK